ncbi:MAG: phosphonate ABC transporter ATP-binding protein [Betaproteobacteria bacterium]|jgi:phosphonate transport system ATP-binding protein
MNAPLVLRHVSKAYASVRALNDVSFSVGPGEFVALLGPSGAGKSTVFRCLTKLAHVDEGDIEVHGQALQNLSGAALRHARRSIGLIFQQHNLIGRLSAMNNVLTGRLAGMPTWRVLGRRFSAADRQAALTCLDRVGLLDKAYLRADALSGGQQQRVAIARVLAQEGSVVLADEPVASLDPESARHVLATLRSVARDQGIAVLCSLHQVGLAREFADRLIGIKAGSIVFDGAPSSIDLAAEQALYGQDSQGDASVPETPPDRRKPSPDVLANAAA